MLKAILDVINFLVSLTDINKKRSRLALIDPCLYSYRDQYDNTMVILRIVVENKLSIPVSISSLSLVGRNNARYQAIRESVQVAPDWFDEIDLPSTRFPLRLESFESSLCTAVFRISAKDRSAPLPPKFSLKGTSVPGFLIDPENISRDAVDYQSIIIEASASPRKILFELKAKVFTLRDLPSHLRGLPSVEP